MKKVLITGAHGFIAKNTACILKEAGLFVIGTSSKPEPVLNFDDIFYGVLGEPLKEVFEEHRVDVVVHCAYNKRDVTNIKNAEGTIIWAEQAEKNKVELQIFMSSLSADEAAITPYGRKKYETERWFLEHNQVVLRPGLVIGNGGLFKTIVSLVKKSPVIPLIDRGKTIAYISDIETVSKVILDIIINIDAPGRRKIWNVQQKTPVFFGDMLKEIGRQSHVKRIFIPVPYIAVSLLLTLGERLQLQKVGINTNNLRGMRQFGRNEYKSDLKYFGNAEVPMKELIKNYFRNVSEGMDK